jgi:hypothetical protein
MIPWSTWVMPGDVKSELEADGRVTPVRRTYRQCDRLIPNSAPKEGSLTSPGSDFRRDTNGPYRPTITTGAVSGSANERGPDNGVRDRGANRTSIRHTCDVDRRTTPGSRFPPTSVQRGVLHGCGLRSSPSGSSKCPWSEWGVSRHLPVYRTATLLRSEFLDGYIRPFPSQVGQERNAGTFMRSWSDCTAPTHPLPRQLGHPSYRRHFLGRSADVIHSCLPASSRSNAAAGRA